MTNIAKGPAVCAARRPDTSGIDKGARLMVVDPGTAEAVFLADVVIKLDHHLVKMLRRRTAGWKAVIVRKGWALRSVVLLVEGDDLLRDRANHARRNHVSRQRRRPGWKD